MNFAHLRSVAVVLLVNLFNACFKEPTLDKIGRVLFARRVIEAPLRAQSAPAEKAPQYQNFEIFLKTTGGGVYMHLYWCAYMLQ